MCSSAGYGYGQSEAYIYPGLREWEWESKIREKYRLHCT
mgnify:CR=1 FL=1